MFLALIFFVTALGFAAYGFYFTAIISLILGLMSLSVSRGV